MAIGTTEVVRGFQVVKAQPMAPALGDVISVCGACGALVLYGWEARHNTDQHAGGLTVRNARGTHEQNAP